VDRAAELAREQRSLGADLLNNVNQPGLYFTLIRGFDGLVAKYMGDGVLAYFGARVPLSRQRYEGGFAQPTDRSFREGGPEARILLPPAVSLVRT
jgi:class 3 adenylate cyclase